MTLAEEEGVHEEESLASLLTSIKDLLDTSEGETRVAALDSQVSSLDRLVSDARKALHRAVQAARDKAREEQVG